MRFSREYLHTVLAAADPPAESVPEPVRPSLLLLRDREGEDVYRAGLWTYAMFSEIGQGRFQIVDTSPSWPFRFLPMSAIGVFDEDFEGVGFGPVIMARPPSASGIIGQIAFPQLDGASFPVVLRSLEEDFHAVPSPSNASSACWVEDRTKQSQWGVLTCRHALSGVAVGAHVTLNSGATARVDRKAPPTIDAAFLTTAAPHNLVKMNLLRYAVPGQNVRVTASAGAAHRSVVTVTDTLGVINDPYHPIKLYLDQPCQPGDSGALVDTHASEGAGIYIGEMTNATVAGRAGQTVGFAQHLEQAIEILDLVPFL
jgi:hypothetical protein